MSYFKPQTNVQTLEYVSFDGEGTDRWDNTVYTYNVKKGSEQMTWTASKHQHNQLSQLNLVAGDMIDVWKESFTNKEGQARSAVQVAIAGDAKSEAVKREAPTPAAPQQSSDLDKRITMGMCMNCASRVVASATSGDINEKAAAETIVALAKAIYAEYTGEPVKEQPKSEEPKLDDLPF